MSELNRQQICAALAVSESTIRRLEQAGLPFTSVGVRSKRYDLAECKRWLRKNPPGAERSSAPASDARLSKAAKEFLESSRKMKLRVMPSEPK